MGDRAIALPNGKCWCGVENPLYEPIADRCDGDRYIECLCGGDFCVCHNHGTVQCVGCLDCNDYDDPEWGDGHTVGTDHDNTDGDGQANADNPPKP